MTILVGIKGQVSKELVNSQGHFEGFMNASYCRSLIRPYLHNMGNLRGQL